MWEQGKKASQNKTHQAGNLGGVIKEQWVLLLDHTPPLSFSASWVGGGLDPLATTGTVRRHGTEGPVPTHVIPRLSPGPGTVEAALGVQP